MSHLNYLQSKIHSQESIPSLIAKWKLKGQKVVFTNGVFDILHKGHVTLLAEAKELGDKLILGLNADASVRTLGKGPERPINAEADRAFVLAGLSSIDAIVIFSEPTPYEIIKLIEPDVLVKGGDYNPEQTDSNAKDYVVGSDLQKARNAETATINLVDGYSTTSVVKKMKHGEN